MNSSGALSPGDPRRRRCSKLFSPTDGIGLSLPAQPDGRLRPGPLRLHVRRHAGRADRPDLAHFSIAHDLADVLPLTKQAQQLNPALTVMASPWTAPAWMKDNGQLNGAG